jgi:hypothetical protein
LKTRFLAATAVAFLALAWVACGPSTPQPDPNNSALCPAGADVVDAGLFGTSCPQAGLSCRYAIAPKPCGAGSTSTKIFSCSQESDGGATWTTLACL